MQKLKSHKTFGGRTEFWSHPSRETKTTMKLSSFIPEGPVHGCLIWLSGLTCTEENFITKAGAQRSLAEHGLMVVAPDTSPRGLNLPGEHDSYDFGSGAGFYLDARTPGYDQHYRMESYIVRELVALIHEQFKISRLGILGHSMGGHGALTLGLRYPALFASISALSPIVNPSAVPWGIKAFQGYLGEDRELWREHDSCELLKRGHRHAAPILIHQGTQDEFFETQLLTRNFEEAARAVDQNHKVVYAEGYDHSYYFISSFIGEHVRHHAEQLRS
ncbi:MAG TPA: S-formylglutathione hydrolase [Oligoflexus sp.]|uniref:S-formylglutathione hydrolase n=1 Tax=Oligoflexus sp. TaxID=1971216 RepID=UPI002D3AFE21|nr:S-formylglutathione hydrolase [Oligoflexus sp.]HYX32352.1 S-formylglutathione hydrolase [Oligoflexus sp.]